MSKIHKIKFFLLVFSFFSVSPVLASISDTDFNEWLKNYNSIKDNINEIKTACLWKKKSSTFTPDFCSVLLDSDPWIVQPTEHYEEIDINKIISKYKKG